MTQVEMIRFQVSTATIKRGIRLTVCALMFLSVGGVAQNDPDELRELNYQAQSEFEPVIKDAIKFADVPEIQDTVQRIQKVQYGINSYPLFPKYQVQPVQAAKLQNEPLNKLYHSVLKIGYAPIYNMPLGELFISNERSRNQSYGAILKHFSSTAHLNDVGYGGFSDNSAKIYGKRFYRRHTLSGELDFQQNTVHYYGFDTSIYNDDRNLNRQRYRLIDPRISLQSHYTDSSHFNHNLQLGFYNLQNLDQETENNIRFKAQGSLFINKEKLNIDFATDFYNHKQNNDTLNNIVVSLNPSFEASGNKWKAGVGLGLALDVFREEITPLLYPLINVEYDIYESLLIPYAGATGGLIKNSLRSLSNENPFVDSTVNYQNTRNRFNFFAGLRGNISSNVSYDARASYSRYDSLHYFVINYSDLNPRHNRFSVLYDNTSVLNVSGQLSYMVSEKWNLVAKGNYYLWSPDNFQRAWHRPDMDMTFSGIYNLKSKIILRADLFIFGKQFARRPVMQDSIQVLQPELIKGWADVNLQAEYRYSRMLSFFARFNNIASQRYYRWDRYPRQRFNFMVGLTFVPF